MSLQASYQLEPELRFGLPRPARIKPQEIASLWGIVLVTLTIACLIGWRASLDLSDLYALRDHGKTWQAVVTDKRTVHSKSDTYYVSYLLRAKNTLIEDEDSVSSSLYERLRKGDSLSVTFLPEQPEIHRLGYVKDRRVRAGWVNWGLGMLAGTGIFILLIAAMVYEARQELYLVRYGVPAAAVISALVPPEPNAKIPNYSVTYRFLLPTGEQTRKCSVSSEVGKLLTEGSTVTVLYDPAKPRHSCLYSALVHTEMT